MKYMILEGSQVVIIPIAAAFTPWIIQVDPEMDMSTDQSRKSVGYSVDITSHNSAVVLGGSSHDLDTWL